MDIGDPRREFTIEPVEDPVPRERPDEPAEPNLLPEQEPEIVRVGLVR